MKRAIFPLFLLIVLFLPVCTNADTVYQVIDLGGGYGEARSISDAGQIVGGYSHATLFDPTGNGNNINLGTIGEYGSCAFSINNSGQIVGWVESSFGVWQATLFDPTGAGNNTYLGGKYAYSINNAGQIVGSARDLWSGNTYAVIFDPTGSGNRIYLGSILGFQDSAALSINDNVQVVGYGINLQKPAPGTTPAQFRALLFDSSGNGNNISLGTLPDYTNSYALSINDGGQIVGSVFGSGLFSFYRASLFDPSGNGNNIDLGTLGGDESFAWSINDVGQIVGWAENDQGYHRATLFDPAGGGNNIDLNTLIDPASGWTLEAASCINNSGWIVGAGINPDGEYHAYLLTPEPATLALLGLGVLFLRKRRK